MVHASAFLSPLMIRVALDGSASGPLRTGIGRYILELVDALARRDDIEPMARAGYDLWPGARAVRDYAPLEGLKVLVHGCLREYLRLGARLRRDAIDVYHATGSRVPARTAGVPIVVTVHDFAAFNYPTLQGRTLGAQVRAQISRAVSTAQWIVLPSESVRAELLQRFPGSASRATAIPHGVGAVFRRAIRKTPTVPTFVSVATLERRKNLSSLIDAFALVISDRPDARLRLLGQPKNEAAAIRARLSRHGLTHAVTIEGYVTDADLVQAYSTATALVYPSLYEGFGLPIVEAMAAGLPVITSNRGAMQEIAADAALLVDPSETDAIASSMLRLANSQSLQQQLETAGRARSAQFTWELSAERHIAVYLAAGGMTQKGDTRGEPEAKASGLR